MADSADSLNKTFLASLEALRRDPELLYRIVDLFPIPIEIFAPDGTTVFFNRAGLEMNNIQDKNLLVGKYNLLKDPVCMDKLGYRKEIEKAFKGEIVVINGFPAPVQDLVDRGVVPEKPYESAAIDLYLYPVMNGEKPAFVVCVFFVRNLYQGKPEIARAREYMNEKWMEPFDVDKIAGVANFSPYYFTRLFKQHTGLTPFTYYKQIKINKIKEKLKDLSISVAQAFTDCGVTYRKEYLDYFKKVIGKTPSEYRKMLVEGAVNRK